MVARDRRPPLAQLLQSARRRGMLGPGPVEAHLEHAESMAAAIEPGFAGRFLDLGSGSGVPGLILLEAWPASTGALLEGRRRRCAFLEDALRDLDFGERGAVVCGRAEELARDADLRGTFDLVVARGFGAPATTAECAVGFLAPGGRLAVSEPPGPADPERWPKRELAELGFRAPELRKGDGSGVAILQVTGLTSDRWPRRVGVPARRPLW
jgi:16S rRNA (guanine527-N7)-methyltransferase